MSRVQGAGEKGDFFNSLLGIYKNRDNRGAAIGSLHRVRTCHIGYL
jgi:hypothetical protein